MVYWLHMEKMKHVMTNQEDFSKPNYVDHEDKLHREKSPVVLNNSNEQFLNQVESNVEDWIGQRRIY